MPRINTGLLFGVIHALNKKSVRVFISNNEANPVQHPKFDKIKSSVSSLRASEATKKALPLADKSNAEYYTEIYVADTNQENGTGHVSASMIKITDSKPEVVKHMSYVPCPGVSSIGAMSCGFAPVGAVNAEHTRDDDINKANTIIRVALTPTQFNQGLEAHETIESGVKDYSYLYAVTGEANIIALMLAKSVNAARGSETTIRNYIEDTGHHPPEDLNGILVMSDYYHPVQSTQTVVLNCTGAVQLVLEGSGLDLDEKYVLPASLGQAILALPGSETVSASLVSPLARDDTEIEQLFPDGGNAYS